jgi:hypothetical protein
MDFRYCLGAETNMANPLTYGWLLYRLADPEPDFMGIYLTREQADADLEVLTETVGGRGWKIASVPFLDRATDAPRAFSRKGKPTLKLVE